MKTMHQVCEAKAGRRQFLKICAASIGIISSRSIVAQPFGPITPLDPVESAMSSFRAAAETASRLGFVGAYRNFYEAHRGGAYVAGTIFLKAPAAEWRDVLLRELGNPPLNNFGARFRGTQEYATRHGFVGGFPNFFHADYGRGIVCGTILVTSDGAEWRDVPLTELGNNLNDIGARFRGTQDYATRNGFVGGFPNMFHADYGNGIVCGTILLRQNVAEWRDVVLYVVR